MKRSSKPPGHGPPRRGKTTGLSILPTGATQPNPIPAEYGISTVIYRLLIIFFNPFDFDTRYAWVCVEGTMLGMLACESVISCAGDVWAKRSFIDFITAWHDNNKHETHSCVSALFSECFSKNSWFAGLVYRFCPAGLVY